MNYLTPEMEQAQKSAARRAAYNQQMGAFQAQRRQLAPVDTAAIERRLDAGDIEGAQRYSAGRLAYDNPGALGDTAAALLKQYPGMPNDVFMGMSKAMDPARHPGANMSDPYGAGQMGAAGELATTITAPFAAARAARAARPAAAGNAQQGGGQTWMPGEVNGQQLAVPTAGNYTNGAYQAEMAGISPDLAAAAPGGVLMSQLKRSRDARMYLDAGMPVPGQLRTGSPSIGLASDIQQKGALQAQRVKKKDQDFQLELAGVKATRGSGSGKKSGDTVGETGQKTGIKSYYQARAAWAKQQQEGKAMETLAQSARTRGDDVVKYKGQEAYVDDLEALSAQYLSAPSPVAGDYYDKPGSAPPAASKPVSSKIGAGTTATPGPGVKVVNSNIKPEEASFLDTITQDKAGEAIRRLESSGHKEHAAYLRQKYSLAAR